MEDVDLGLKLLAFCRQFISEQNITAPETIYQSDRVVLGSYEFIEGVCDIAGYVPTEDDEDEDEAA